MKKRFLPFVVEILAVAIVAAITAKLLTVLILQ